MQKVTADIGIIAAGPAGLAASVAAAEQGVSVVVFEKMANAGGTANMGMGPFGVESRIQKVLLDDLTKEKAFQMMMDYTHWAVDARIVRDYFWKSGSTIDWLEDMGVEFDRPTKYYPGGCATWHVVKPEGGGIPGPRAASAMNKVLHKTAVELGVKFYFETPVTEIRREGDKIVGFHAVSRDGEEYEVSTKATIVATGGFGSNPEMVKEYTGYTIGEDFFPNIIPNIVGEGLKMAWKAGAGKGHMEMERIMGCEVPFDGSFVSIMLFAQASALMINRLGERFIDETQIQNGAVCANAVTRQPGKMAWQILDDGILKHFRRHGLDFPNQVFRMNAAEVFYEEIDRMAAQYPHAVVIADSLEELAEKMGVDVDEFLDTVDEYNAYCEDRHDDLFLKDMKYLHALAGKRFYALRVTAGAYGSLGGIMINRKYQVLDQDWNKIEGFYAAGSDVCDIYAGTYQYKLAGNTMGFAVNSGRMAGENAADYVRDIQDE